MDEPKKTKVLSTGQSRTTTLSQNGVEVFHHAVNAVVIPGMHTMQWGENPPHNWSQRQKWVTCECEAPNGGQPLLVSAALRRPLKAAEARPKINQPMASGMNWKKTWMCLATSPGFSAYNGTSPSSAASSGKWSLIKTLPDANTWAKGAMMIATATMVVEVAPRIRDYSPFPGHAASLLWYQEQSYVNAKISQKTKSLFAVKSTLLEL